MFRIMLAAVAGMALAGPAAAVVQLPKTQTQTVSWSQAFTITGLGGINPVVSLGAAPTIRFAQFNVAPRPLLISAALTGVRITDSSNQLSFSVTATNPNGAAQTGSTVTISGNSVLANAGLGYSDTTAYSLTTPGFNISGRLSGIDGTGIGGASGTGADSLFNAASFVPFEGTGTFDLSHSITSLIGSLSSGANVTANVTGNFSGTTVVEYAYTETVVPEPSSWVMMIGGFGLVGMTLRRRERLRLA